MYTCIDIIDHFSECFHIVPRKERDNKTKYRSNDRADNVKVEGEHEVLVVRT